MENTVECGAGIKEEAVIDTVSFCKELEGLINKYSIENRSNTPDFILARYMCLCLETFEKASLEREKWFGKSLDILS